MTKAVAAKDHAFDALFAAHYHRLARAICRVVGDTGRAEELASEAFWRLHRNPPRFDRNLAGWLYRAGLRLALDSLKMQKRRAFYEGGADPPAPLPTPEESLAQGEERARVRATLAALKPEFASWTSIRPRWASSSNAPRQPSAPTEWQPDTAAALRRHHARRQEEWRRGPGVWWKMAIAAAVLLALVLAPPARVLAQRFWKYLTVGRIQVMQLDLEAIPDGSSLRARIVQHPGKTIKVDGAESARAHLGFLPRLPRSGVLSGPPRLSVMGTVVYGTTLKADDLRQLLQKAGIVGETVPPEWDGARLLVQIPSMAMAEWPEPDTMLMQSLPLTMVTPDNFDLRAFTTLTLRGLKAPRHEAERLGARMASAPAWVLGLGAEDKVGIREVALRTGPATMVYDYDTGHPDRIERLTLIWSVSDRIYVMSTAMNDAQAIAVANSIE